MGINLYHYTTLGKFKSIWNSHKLKMSNIPDVRDNTEIKACKKILRECDLKQYYSEIKKIRRKSYVSCFTTDANNDRLWEEYADQEKGVVICFDSIHFPPYAKYPSMTRNCNRSELEIYPGIQLFKTNYSITCELLKNLISDECSLNSKQKSLPINNVIPRSLLLLIGDAFKSQWFEYENEIRLAMYYNSNTLPLPDVNKYPDYCLYHKVINENDDFYYDLLSYREKNKKLKEHNFYHTNISSITKIFCKFKDTYDEVTETINNNKLEIKNIPAVHLMKLIP